MRCGLTGCFVISSRQVEQYATMQADEPKIETDPNLAAEQAAAQRSLITGLQNQTQLDTANIMARYGTRLALANSGALPTAAATPTTTTSSTTAVRAA